MLLRFVRFLSNPSSEKQIVAYLGSYFKGRILTSACLEPAKKKSFRLITSASLSQPCIKHNYSFTDNYLSQNSGEYEPNRSEDVVLHIVKWFDCLDEEASQILDSMPQLRSAHLETIDGYVSFLKGSGITIPLIRQNLWLLEHSITTMRPKIRIIASMFGINANTVPLLKVARKALHLYVLQNGKSDLFDRIAFISTSLECPREEVINLIMKDSRWFILSMKYDRLVRKMGLLLDYGVPPSDIRNDLWVFKNDEKHLRERLCRAVAAKVDPIKPWMLRCTDSRFVKVLEHGQHDRLEYLVQRLGYGHREIATLLRQYRNLSTISVVKMKNVFDLLYAKGISSDQIYRYPFVLGCRLELLNHRLKELDAIGLKVSGRLHVLRWSRRRFENALQEMKINDKELK